VNFARFAADVTPQKPDLQAEYLGLRLSKATSEADDAEDYSKPCYASDRERKIDGLEAVKGPASGFPVFHTVDQTRYVISVVAFSSN
jgi:hypothetical protein